jgi:hypothetical protein
MAADQVVSRELNALQAELAAAQRAGEPPAALEHAPIATPAAAAAGAGTAAVEEAELSRQLQEFVDEVTAFFHQAEKNIAAHPAESVVGALVVGILIGRMLGRH